MKLATITLDSLERRLKELLSNERRIQADFLMHLAELDRRRGYEAHGYSSLWMYCFRELHCSERQAFYRSHAAQLVRRFPAAAEFLADGRICMTTLVDLRTILTEENAARTLREVVGKTKDEVQRMVASVNPIPVPQETMIRRVPYVLKSVSAPATVPFPSATSPEVATDGIGVTSAPVAMWAPAQPESSPRSEILPVSSEQFRIRLLVESEFKQKLDRAASYLSHRFPDLDPRKVLEYGLDLILREASKRQDPGAVRPRKSTFVADEASPYIPVDLRRLVWERDGGCCVWKTTAGPCGSTYQLEVDHILALALGGKTVLDNLRLVCAAHNRLHARQGFGTPFIQRKIETARSH